jgi:sugar O-acyltransferase (sialic acid O-acetyltransferase NeuD family)
VNESILIIGGGGHARAVVDVIEAEGRFQVAGIVDPGLEVGGEVLGYPVLGGDDDLPDLLDRVPRVIIAVGQILTPAPRIDLFDLLRSMGAEFPIIVAPTAQVSPHARIGAGTIVMHHAHVGPAARIGTNCILNTRSLVEHDAVVEDHVHVATGAILNGGVRVGRGAFIGSNTVVREGVVVGPQAVVGCGAVILHDVPEGRMVKGLNGEGEPCAC